MRRWIPAHGVMLASAAVLAFVPLTQVLGFEFAVTLGALLVIVSGWLGVAYGVDARRPDADTPPTDSLDPAQFPGRALLQTLLTTLALLPPPVLLLALNGWRVPNCDWGEGLRFTAVVGIPAVLYGASLGFLVGLRCSVWRGRLLFLGWLLGTVLWAIWNVVREPPIFAFNAVWAWFPGPVYDRIVSLEPRFLVARGLVVLEAVCFVCAAAVFWDGRHLRVRALAQATRGWRAVPLVVGTLALSAFLVAQVESDRLGLRIHRSFIQAQLGGRIDTPHCTIFYAEQAYPPERARELALEHEFHYDELSQWFGTQPTRRIRSYVYASAAQKKRLMGAAGTNFEDALNDEFHINADGFPHPILRHEMAHIFAAQIDRWWPVCPLMGIHEGIAVAADWREASGSTELTPDEACVAMQQLGVLPDLQSTLGAFGFWTQSSARAYTVAGSFLHDLVETYGMAAFHRLWSNRDFAATYGHSLAELIGEWQQRRLDPIHLTARQVRRAQDLYLHRSVFQEPCAHEQAQLRADAARATAIQPRVADSLYARLLEIEPGEASSWFGRVRAQLRAREAVEALQTLEAMTQRVSLRGADSIRVARFAGDAAWLLGDVETAATHYASALQDAADRPTRRALQVNLAVLRSPVQRELLRDYLIESNQDDTASLALLATAVARDPASPWPRYLLARRLYYANRFEQAVEELHAVLEHDLPADVSLASHELLAWSFLRLGDSRGCVAELDATRLAGWNTAERLRLEDLRRRAVALEGSLGRIFPGTFPPGGR